MRKPYPKQLAKTAALGLALLIALFPARGRADDATPPAPTYQLDVTINGQSTGLVAKFADMGDGRFASPVSEMRELGFKVPEGGKDDDLIPLDGFQGLSYVYDEQKQAIAIETNDANRVSKFYDARSESDLVAVTPSDYGAVLNYTVFGSHGGDQGITSVNNAYNFSGLNTSLDGRLIFPLGVLNQTAIVGMTLADESQALRLETTYTFSDDENLVRWKAGDFISGGTNWSRPVRLGGVQAQRAFSMRPDLVKSPLPAVSGSAAVPSAVDVYVNGIKSYSKQVAAGPYQIDNIPTVTGSGVAQVVTRDASGRESVQSLNFYNSPQLLRQGLYDFSVESGLTRSHYGIESWGYGDALIGSGTLRGGVNDWLTLETHGEGGDGLFNLGAGLVARALDMGIVSAAATGSSSSKGTGYQLYGGLETKVGTVSINARTQHSFDDYDDLASLTARDNPFIPTVNAFGVAGLSTSFFSFAPPRAIDQITFSTPISFDKSTISATYLRYQAADEDTTELVTTTYSRPLIENANFYATGYVDINDTNKSGFYLGVSMPLGNDVSVNAGLSKQNGDYTPSIDAAKPVTQETGSWGWRIRDYEGSNQYRTAAVGYRAEMAKVEAGVVQNSGDVSVTATVEGAVAVLGGNVYASNRIDDSFAVVDAHAPGVKVQHQNLLVGATNDDGKILIPGLTSYNKNKIAIDPMDLPLNAEMATTYKYVAPGYKSGVYVDFDVKQATPNAIVVLKGIDGQFIPAGSEGHIDGSDEPFIVGYDGQAFIKDLHAVNTFHVTLENGICSGQFSFAPTSDVQPQIGPEMCQ